MEKSTRKINPLVALFGVGALAGIVMALLTIFGNDVLQSATGQSAARQPTPAPDLIRVGEPALDFTLTNLEGEDVALSDYRGQVVAINFWATWCGPCRDEMPALQAASENNDDLVILAVNTGEPAARVERFMTELELTFPALLDRSEDVADLYGVRAMPTTVWVDAEGIVQFEHFGPLTERQIDQYIVALSDTN